MLSPHDTEVEESPPRTLGEYSVVTRIARGGMATVFVGRKEGAAGFERIVAIKCCHPHLRENQAFRRMFLEEARLAAKIHHPNVVATLDVSDGSPLYLVMEHVEGESLASLRRLTMAYGPIPIEVTLRIIIDTLSGLHAAHECVDSDGVSLGLVHCDVSPQNILVGLDGVTRIADFGIARAAAHASGEADMVKGKFSYMAPEQLRAGRLTPATDVFGAGVVLWETLVGRRLFQRDNDEATIQAALNDVVPAPSSIDPRIPAVLDAVVLRALERDARLRYQNAAEFLAALEELVITAATPRQTSEYLRAVIGEDVIAERRTTFDRRSEETRTMSGVRLHMNTDVEIEVEHDLTMGQRDALDTATMVVEPTAKLLEQTREPGPRSADSIPPHRQNMRRMIVAVTLLLLGCGVGVLFATSHAAPPAPPAQTPVGR